MFAGKLYEYHEPNKFDVLWKNSRHLNLVERSRGTIPHHLMVLSIEMLHYFPLKYNL